MKNKKTKHLLKVHKFLLCLLLTLCASHSWSQELTLQQAYDLLLLNNGEVKASNFVVKAAEESHKATKGLRLPTLKVSGTYLHLEDDITVDLNPQRTMVSGLLGIPDPTVLGDWNITLQEKNLGYASAGLTMPIFAGGKINAANKASKIQVDLATTKHQLKTDELTLQLISYFLKLQLAKEAEKLRQEVYDVILLHNNQAEKFFKNGLIPEVETLNAKVALANAYRELLGAKKDVSLATTALQNLIGFNGDFTITTSFSIPSNVPSLQVFQDDMLRENLQLELLQKNYDLATVGVKVATSDYFPTIGVQGSYRLWKDNLPLLNTKWFAGVGIGWEVFNGFQRAHKIAESKYKIAQVASYQKQAQLNLATYTEKLYNTVQKELEQYQSLNADEALAAKLKFMRTRAFEEGTGTSLEVIDATLKASEIKLKKMNALFQYNSAYGELMVLTGKTALYLTQN